MQTNIKIKHMTETECWERVCEQGKSIHDPDYRDARDHFGKAYKQAVAGNLRFHVPSLTAYFGGEMLAYPVSHREWPDYSAEDARNAIAWEVWCMAVRLRNLARFAA